MNDTGRKPPAYVYVPDLTDMQERVAVLIGEGLTYELIGTRLNMSPHTARAHANAVAGKLPNPHKLPAQRLIAAWLIARQFLRESA